MTTTAVTTTKPKAGPADIGTLLEMNKGAFLQALPKTVTVDRFLRVAMNSINRNPDLQKCTAASLYAGIMQSAQFGLEIGLMNQAHLVPYWNSEKKCFEAQFQIGYLGLRDLAERYGDVVDGDAQAVYEKDAFDYGQGDSPYIAHKPSKDQSRGEIVHFYCWAQPKDGKLKVAVMSRAEVEDHKKKFVREKKSGGYGPAWTTTFEAMAIKTVIRRCYKLLARSPELREAVALDELQEVNIPQNLGIELEIEQRDAMRQDNAKRLEQVQQQENGQGAASPTGASESGVRPADVLARSDDALDTADHGEKQTDTGDPAEIYRIKLRVCERDPKVITHTYNAIPPELRQDCHGEFQTQLQSLSKKK